MQVVCEADTFAEARVHQFQLGQGLTPDGQAGPLTLMMLTAPPVCENPVCAREAEAHVLHS